MKMIGELIYEVMKILFMKKYQPFVYSTIIYVVDRINLIRH